MTLNQIGKYFSACFTAAVMVYVICLIMKVQFTERYVFYVIAGLALLRTMEE